MNSKFCLKFIGCVFAISGFTPLFSADRHSVHTGHVAPKSGNVGAAVQPSVSVPSGGNVSQVAPNPGFRSSLQPGLGASGGGPVTTPNFNPSPQANFGHRGGQVGSGIPSMGNGISNQGGNSIHFGGNTNFAPGAANGIQQPGSLPANGVQAIQPLGSVPTTTGNVHHHRIHPGTVSQNGVQPLNVAPGTGNGTQPGSISNLAAGTVSNQIPVQSIPVNNAGLTVGRTNYQLRNANLNQQSFSANPIQGRAGHTGNAGNALTQDNLIVYSGFGQGYFDRNFGVTPLYLGYGAGFGSMAFSSGYLGYNNPYAVNDQLANTGYNYSQPVVANPQVPVSAPAYQPPASVSLPLPPAEPAGSSGVPQTVEPRIVEQVRPSNVQSPTPSPSTSNQLQLLLDTSVRAFKQNHLDKALDVANKGIVQAPSDVVFHELRALILFAKGDYQQSAATMHSVLAAGPGWDWNTMIGLYSDASVYTGQLRALERSVKQNPSDGASRFLLAYHYLTAGRPENTEAAVRILKRVVTLVPNDQVAASLLQSLQQTKQPELAQPALPPPPSEPVESPKPIEPAKVIGDWNANRPDGSKFSLKLNADKSFVWSFEPNQKPPQTFDGTYSITDRTITLNRTGGGMLAAEIQPSDDSRFRFKLFGAPADDPGLDFTRAAQIVQN